MNPKFISIVFCFFNLSLCNAQEKAIDTILFPIEELQEDFNFWRNHLENKHPIIYHYNSSDRFTEYFDSIFQEIDRPMTKTQFFRLIGPTTSFTKCGHSQVYAGSEIGNYIMDDEHLIPIDIKWFYDTAYVSYNYTNESNLSAGTIVTMINGVYTEELYEQCISLLPGDGYSLSYARYWVNRQFYYYYHLLYGLNRQYEISILNENNTTNTFVVNGMSISTMDSIELEKPKLFKDKNEGIESYLIDSLNTAYLRVGSFANSAYKKIHKKRYKKVVDEHLSTLLNSDLEYLIIDIRGNDGGQPANPLYLLRHVMTEVFEFKHELRTIKNKNETESLSRSKKPMIPDAQVGTFRPFKNHFNGKVYVLVNGGSTSAAGEFVSVIKRYKRGEIIGTESGGNPVILTGFGIGSIKKLPNTKLPFNFGERTTFMDTPSKDNGFCLIPDFIVEPTIRDFLNKKDRALLFTLKQIQEL